MLQIEFYWKNLNSCLEGGMFAETAAVALFRLPVPVVPRLR